MRGKSGRFKITQADKKTFMREKVMKWFRGRGFAGDRLILFKPNITNYEMVMCEGVRVYYNNISTTICYVFYNEMEGARWK